MVGVAMCRAVQRALACDGGYIASTNMYVHVPVMFFHSKWITKVRSLPYVSLLQKGPHGLKASDARLEFETAQRYFDLFLFTLTSPNATCKNCGRSDNVNCLCGGNREKT